MAHRDDLEAAHRRIEALARQLDEARTTPANDATRKADAQTSDDLAKKGRRKATRAAPREPDPDANGSWPQRKRFRRGITWLAAAIYGASSIAFFVTAQPELGPAAGITIASAALGFAIATGVLGVVCRAPEAYGGGVATLLVSGVALVPGMFCASDEALASVVSAPAAQAALRVAALLVGPALGTVIARAWIPDAAASPIQAD